MGWKTAKNVRKLRMAFALLLIESPVSGCVDLTLRQGDCDVPFTRREGAMLRLASSNDSR
jgi:hypothetical protein